MMMKDRAAGPKHPDVAESERSSPPAYEPPAVVWEEPFEAVCASSCAFNPLSQDQCQLKPQV